jgi:uncharacterized protein YndB with AHSA1/START domain
MDHFKIDAKGATEIVVERHFKADVEAVVKAFLEPDLLMKWMSGPDMPLESVGLDARPGGEFRYVWGAADQDKMVMTGHFRDMEVAENGDRLIVHSENFDPDWTGGETLVRTDYVARNGGTLVRTTITYSTTDARDAALASEMGDAMQDSYVRLDAVLAAG